MDNTKKSKKDNKKIEPGIANDQLGENEIDKDLADKYRQVRDNKKGK
ncbi:MAG: hypothetical protein Q8942_17040 [Bacillota bacterium]|nr:hypothetical protein [Bacillota bacterium]